MPRLAEGAVTPINAFFEEQTEGEVIYSYLGPATPAVTEEAFEVVESALVTCEKAQAKKVFSAFVESLQNLFHHGAPPDYRNVSNPTAAPVCIVLKQTSSGFRISTGNYVSGAMVGPLEERLEWLNCQSMDELRVQMHERLRSEQGPEEGPVGAGLGLLRLAALAEKFDYSLSPPISSWTLFTLHLNFDSTMEKAPEEVFIERTAKTPQVRMDAVKGKLDFVGRSIPEDAIGFYQPVLEWIRCVVDSRPPKIDVTVQIDYLNTSSAKCILDVFKKLEGVNRDGVPVEVDWLYEEDDEDMLEMGEDYQSIVDLPFSVRSTDDTG